MSVQALSCAMAIRGVSASEKLLLLVLANYADEHMRSFPSHSRLSGDTGLSERTILTLMKGLEARLMLSRKERRRPDGSRSTDIITLHFGGEVISPRGEDVAPRVGKSTTGGGEMVSPLTTFEPSLEEPKEPTTSNAPAIDWRQMLVEAKAAAGDAADLTRPAMHHAADLRALVEPKTGEPCAWSEVLDAIAMVAMRQTAKGKPIASWSWVRDDALALRDKRLNAANPPPGEVVQLRATGPPNIAAQIAADNAEAERRAFAMLDRQDGRKN